MKLITQLSRLTKKIQKDRNLTQKQLATLAKVNTNNISKLENKDGNIKWETFCRIALATGHDIYI